MSGNATTASGRPSNWTIADVMAACKKMRAIPAMPRRVVVCDFATELWLQTNLPRITESFFGCPASLPIHVIPGTDGYRVILESDLELFRTEMGKKLSDRSIS